MKRRIFVDMDGTLAKWHNVESEEILLEKGYYENLEPNRNLVNAIKELIRNGEDIYILSSFLSNSNFALEEKKKWLEKYLPEIPLEKQIFVKYGDNKTSYIPGGTDKNDYLIDDYTKNLIPWKEAGGIGIKFLNGINNTKGTWKGAFIKDNENLKQDLEYILDYPEKSSDEFNKNLLEISKELDNAVKGYDLISDSTKDGFSNIGSKINNIREKYINEKQHLKSLYNIEILDSWLDDNIMVIRYNISFKDGRLLYEGYGFCESTSSLCTDEMLKDMVLGFDVKNRLDITKISKELQILIKSVMSMASENTRFYVEDLADAWDINESDVPDKIITIEAQLKELGIENYVNINMIDTYPKRLEYLDIDFSILSKFDLSNDGKHSKTLNLSVNDKEVICNLEFNKSMGGWAVSGYTVDNNQTLTKEEMAMLQAKIFNEINKIYDEEFPKIETEIDIDITDDLY